MSHRRCRCFVDQPPVAKAIEIKGGVDPVRLDIAIVCANKSPAPGVALKPPVPQPQLT